jgi:hypothetical protein
MKISALEKINLSCTFKHQHSLNHARNVSPNFLSILLQQQPQYGYVVHHSALIVPAKTEPSSIPEFVHLKRLVKYSTNDLKPGGRVDRS